MERTPTNVDRTRDHWWWRPGWRAGARYFTFHLTFEDGTELKDAADRVALRLHGAGAVDLVPVEWLHLTMTGVGFTTDIDDQGLDELTQAVFSRIATIETEPLRFHRSFVYSEGFGLAPRPAPWLDEIKSIQSSAVSSIRDVANDSVFQPHVSLAYFSGEADLDLIDEARRALPEGDILVDHPRLSLIELGRDNRVYTWRVVHQLILGR